MKTLEQLLQPQKQSEVKRYSMRIDGMPKTGKTALALAASAQCPHPKEWSKEKKVEINDLLWLGFEENCLLYPNRKGVHVKHLYDWSSSDLQWDQLKSAIKA